MRSRLITDLVFFAWMPWAIATRYAGMSTNVVAQRAGVSVGSLYQYFPNKDALLAALHNRHAAEMAQSLETILAVPGKSGLRGEVERLVRGAMAVHEVEPQLHRLLEKERPFFQEQNGEPGVATEIHRHIQRLLAAHPDEVNHPDLALAAWMTMRMTETLVHAAVLHPPHQLDVARIEGAIVDAIHAFLTYSRER